ncbi:MAG: glycosyltransferase family 4 protein [Verrucomicrobia bacterium]|nr:glycosyltransferase family 4 protein [Verrucomicrobiota bacterium]
MKILQILPELNSGGVERGTLEVAAHLVRNGHEALVVSNGGRLVERLERSGARHLTMPVHRKSLATLFQIGRLRRVLREERPDVVHIRSRVPGWVAWLAWRGLPEATRPRLVSTVHGFYSVNAYSAVMTRGERVIAVSESVREYILKNYPAVSVDRVRVIHRGVAPNEFPRGYQPADEWQARWREANPALEGKSTLLLPGRITRWKGQEDLLELVAALKARGEAVHGLIAGETHPKKRAYAEELLARAAQLGVGEDVTFLGHRDDVREVMAVSDLVLSLSREPEAFGRVSLEAVALGRPVVGYDHGGVGEQLRVLFSGGLTPLGDGAALIETTLGVLRGQGRPGVVEAPFTQAAMCGATEAVYRELAAAR